MVVPNAQRQHHVPNWQLMAGSLMISDRVFCSTLELSWTLQANPIHGHGSLLNSATMQNKATNSN